MMAAMRQAVRTTALIGLKAELAAARERFQKHGYEADARECERLVAAIRGIDPDFEERR